LEALLNWLDRLERRLGFLAVPNLILAVIGGQAAATLLALGQPSLPLLLWMDPVSVAQGQWWRLLTWVIVPSTSPLSLIFAVFWFWFLWIIGSALETAWGSFKCTVYLALGVLLPPLGSLIAYKLFGTGVTLTGFYFSASLQLAFAVLAPEFTIYLFLLLPVKMRWLAWAMGAWFCWRVVSAGLQWGPTAFWLSALEVGFGVGNYIVFFLPQAWRSSRQRKAVAANRKVFEAAAKESAALQARACAECGAGTEGDLRLCTCPRCGEDGRFWCAEHLGPHLGRPPKAEAEEDGDPPPTPRRAVPKKGGTAKKAKTKRKG
jgi:hypothetical protein